MTKDNSGVERSLVSHIPTSLSEIADQITVMIFEAPTFVDPTGVFATRNIDSEFAVLEEGFRLTRSKLGESRYIVLVDLATRAKALFVADHDDSNGKADEGRALLLQIEDVIKDARHSRGKTKMTDQKDEISED